MTAAALDAEPVDLPFPLHAVPARLAWWGWTLPELADALAYHRSQMTTQGQFRHYVAMIERWCTLSGEPKVSHAGVPTGVSPALARWIQIGQPYFGVSTLARLTTVCGLLLTSVGYPPPQAGANVFRAGDPAHEQVLGAHRMWRRLLPPKQHGALYLDLAYAGMGLREVSRLLPRQDVSGPRRVRAETEAVLGQLRAIAALSPRTI